MVDKAQWAAIAYQVAGGLKGTFVIPLAALTPTGTQGSITVVNGTITAIVLPT